MRLAKTYNPNEYEPNIYAMWESAGAFNPTGAGEPYSIVMPPANANGNLHIGHALTIGLEDILARYYRMKGRDVIYIPGEDHAGLETWVVYERELAKQGRSRFDYTREQIYSQVWNFVDIHRGNTELQVRALGASVAWKDLVYTLDKKVIERVHKTFKQMWDEGLIYRGERIVNYSTKYQTGYADIEVNHKMEKGTLYLISYPTIDKIGEIIIATTRPETMFGDTAVAVNPNDERYKHLIGSRVLLPLTDREIPVIADDYVDPKFGTGAVKITPAHDPNDFEVGERHNLERIQVIDFDGTMINTPAQFIGLTPEEARKRVVAALEAQESIKGKTIIEHSVGYDYKSGLPIQPLIKEQWFLKIGPLAQRAKKAIENGDISFTPASRKKFLISYLENIHDWNLSRQIPWGIPIPAFQNVKDPEDWIFDDRVDEKTIVVDGTTYRREEDTFDTWFSSGQWPYVTTDFLDDGDLKRFYPLSVMETGSDILTSWVARMVMFGLYATDEVPFRDVYLHGLVLDAKGQKMSKSKGNVVNPMEIIAEYGSDALRLGLVASRSAGQNQAFSTSKVVAGRNFANKLWNVARFVEDKLGEHYMPSLPEPVSMADHWIVNELNTAMADISKQLETYRFAEAGESVYHAIWDSVADWYIEASKQQDNPDLLAWVLDTCLKIAHPFAPFVTETIWQTLSWHKDLLIKTAWPEPIECNDIAAGEFGQLKNLVSEIRFITSELPGNERYTLLFNDDTLIADNSALITKLARLQQITRVDQPKGLRLPASGREAWLDVSDETLYEHQTNLEIRLAEAHAAIANFEARLASKSYVEKAPAKLVDETKQELATKKTLVIALQRELDVLK
ncbi:valine--tRNA ligase [soil metagenome]